ncbi:saccharopine dehydrogenase NADP-binding domain-containing protein [Ferruginibacter lapsinanis]|uniref:saccharopine dehydrogenase C-terminal domain-containing protein n=1 Tax=Ferruginibacter lapsinanis TaxID=563172 RepID=UPI001E32427B|nr:saccharopine dehydrogenase C-terminal domain-containing protein [Ferruginibacter lapsinanis]UEG49414.1 saccharopine dehydrogenase NADP-binding domain-containing protein [Ferruginibacter lapsinanis]
MKTILLFGAGKSATVLIDYLLEETKTNKWKFIIADANKEQIVSKTNHSPFAEAIEMDITDDDKREAVIQRAHVVISMMPPALHYLIAKDCVELRKHLLTASYIDNKIKSLSDEIRHRKLLFLCEMGLDPGIDHMSAMKLIDGIKNEGGAITSFKSHCGGLVAPESDDNPWHYKISWNPRNVVLAGKSGANYKEHNATLHKSYEGLFTHCEEVVVDGLPPLVYYPNRDSLSYIPIYKLQSVQTFIRTTLRHPVFCIGWDAIVQADLTNDMDVINTSGLTFSAWSAAILPFVNDSNKTLLAYLGLFEDEPVPTTAKTSADILQYLLELKLPMKSEDKDMVVMLHEIIYELKGKLYDVKSSLVVEGEDGIRTAMAKTVGLPLGITAKLLLNGDIKLTGLHIPIIKEIYDPVLHELSNMGICFTEKRS